MQKIVINKRHGGFGLSKLASDIFCDTKCIVKGTWDDSLQYYSGFDSSDISREDPLLIEIVTNLGTDASGVFSKLVVVEIPDGVEWEISDNAGFEWIAEKHRTWS